MPRFALLAIELQHNKINIRISEKYYRQTENALWSRRVCALRVFRSQSRYPLPSRTMDRELTNDGDSPDARSWAVQFEEEMDTTDGPAEDAGDAPIPSVAGQSHGRPPVDTGECHHTGVAEGTRATVPVVHKSVPRVAGDEGGCLPGTSGSQTAVVHLPDVGERFG